MFQIKVLNICISIISSFYSGNKHELHERNSIHMLSYLSFSTLILKPNHTLTSITDETRGLCLQNNKPVVNNKIPNELIPVGRCYEKSIPETTFYDVEDGNTRNLAISLQSIQNQQYARNYWMHIQNQHICGITPAISWLDV